MKTRVLMLGCLLATASVAQSTSERRDVWVWKDADGVTHYSDYPSPGARKLVLVGSTPTTSAPTPTTSASAPAAERPRAGTQYKSLEVSSPQNEMSFYGSDAEVPVRLHSEPTLGPGDRLLTYLDGRLLQAENTYEHRLTGLARGAHSLTASIVNGNDVEQIRSKSVTFYIQQPSTIDNPRNKGPAVRPPQPKPAGR